MVERLRPSQVIGFGTPEETARYIEQDFRIRSGLCPNGHGLMTIDRGLQHCTQCKFTTNALPELTKN